MNAYQIVLKGVKMVFALLQIHALAMKASFMIKTRDVFLSVPEVV
jgi:hypothetical protein